MKLLAVASLSVGSVLSKNEGGQVFKPFSCTHSKIVELSELQIGHELLAWSEGQETPDCFAITEIQWLGNSKSKSDFTPDGFRIVLENKAELDVFEQNIISKAKTCSSLGSCSGMSMQPMGGGWCSGIGCSSRSGGMKMNPFNSGFSMKPMSNSWCSGTMCNNGMSRNNGFSSYKPSFSSMKPTSSNNGMAWCSGTACQGQPASVRRIGNSSKPPSNRAWCSGTGCGNLGSTVTRIPMGNNGNSKNGNTMAWCSWC